MAVLSTAGRPDATGAAGAPRAGPGGARSALRGRRQWAYTGDMAHTGEHIRAVRARQGIELERVAAALGREPGWLAKVERCEAEPSVPELLRIAAALQTDISELIYGQRFEAKKAIVTRRAERVRVQRTRSYEYESLAPRYIGRKVEPLYVTVHPGPDPRRQDAAGPPEASTHAGEEFLYVLEGKLRIVIDGAASVLEPGDSVYFDSSLPHELSGAGGPARLVAMICNAENMVQLTRSRRMRDLIHGARHARGKELALVCPDGTSLEALDRALEENVVERAWLFGDPSAWPPGSPQRRERCEVRAFDPRDPAFPAACAEAAVAAVREGRAHMLMKGDINTSVFLKAALHRTEGIGTGRRLSMVSIFELPRVERLIFLTDPAINPFLTQGDDLDTSRDIILNAIEVARGIGVERPKVAILDANELPTAAVPTTLNAHRLAEMSWPGADVYGPLSYDLALYPEAVEHKGLQGNPVAGKADILAVPYLSSGNILYKAWAMTMAAEVANVVVGAKAPIIITSRADSDLTKFLTICACAVFSQHLRGRENGEPASP